jgi:adenosylmethionine-8-amino-7-oxononanoate aminotransferase
MSVLRDRDKELIWHPYTPQNSSTDQIPVVKAEGVYLIDENNNRYIDAISSWWVTIHGHAHAYIAQKIYEQALQLEQVIFAGFTHVPGSFSKIFFSDNGSTAVEVGVKMAIQFWYNQGIQKRKKILVLTNAYHGDTFGAMSLSERGVFTIAFKSYLFEVIFIDAPDHNNIDAILSGLGSNIEEIACFIYEPLLQGAGGMKMYEAVHLDSLLNFLHENKVICIADEVMTGFGRTGKLFAGDQLAQKADIICLSKGLTGGTMAMGVTACTNRIHQAFVSDDRMKTFFHGHSFTANPIACASALASLDLLLGNECMEGIARITNLHERFLMRIGSSKLIKNPRQCGTVLAFEILAGKDEYLNTIGRSLAARALENGIFLRPLGNTVYIMPPYCITEDELEKVYAFLETFLVNS